jgi:hypothetical protein
MLDGIIVTRSTNFEEATLMKSNASSDFTERSYENLSDDPQLNWKTDSES